MRTEKRLVFFDLDGTISKRDTYKEILLFGLYYRPIRLIYIPLSFYDYTMFIFGFYSNTIVKERLLKRVFGGIGSDTLQRVVVSYIKYFLKNNLKKNAVKSIQMHKANNDYVVLVTASFDFYVREIGRILGFDQVICTVTKKNKSHLTGSIDGNNCYSKNKVKAIKKEIKVDRFESIVCYTDHHSDIPLIKFCDTVYLVDPTKRLEQNQEFNKAGVLKWK
jgi:phosphatidylglycerophosphatase C